MVILGIETSCDETAASVVEFSNSCRKTNGDSCLPAEISVLSGIVSSQIDIHKKYGGVVPEVAARAHIENIIPVIKEAMEKGGVEPEKIDALAVTAGPGLITSLIVGLETAKNLAYSWNKPLIAVNHLEGHIAANWLGLMEKKFRSETVREDEIFPALCLIVSGGHTELVLIREYGQHEKIGQTRDDAAGEAFDKAAKLMGLGYPGGPEISRMAENGNPKAFDLPRPMMHRGFDFSFSGLKTAVLYLVRDIGELSNRQKADMCASFQEAVADVLTSKAVRAAEKYGAKTVMLAGGVAANLALRQSLKNGCASRGLEFYVPPISLCTDNATMIALAGYSHFIKKEFAGLDGLKADPNMQL